MISLRSWQKQCIDKIRLQYSHGQKHFLCLATPGAGKTYMSAQLAKTLIAEESIDLVICFAPSSVVATEFGHTVSDVLGRSMSGMLSAVGASYTYQKMLTLDDEFWDLFSTHRILVIFDEIHHCSGNRFIKGNSWGDIIVSKIQKKAAYTLALSGTPWRTDYIPISLANYCDHGNVVCDFNYGLNDAIKDKVCRAPSFVGLDAQRFLYKGQKFNSLVHFLGSFGDAYKSVLENEKFIKFALRQTHKSLRSSIASYSDSACLIVASNVSHAKKIQNLLYSTLGELSDVVSYEDSNSKSIIQRFKSSNQKYIISIGMISEGTNIPRLKVCCFLSHFRTELYFRQVLGRVLRFVGPSDREGLFLYPYCNELISYVTRICKDVPDYSIQQDKVITGYKEPFILSESGNEGIKKQDDNLDNEIFWEGKDTANESLTLKQPRNKNLTDAKETNDLDIEAFKARIISQYLTTLT